jgi:3'-phosphoadenosine 5'-phosphosulfate sulfotransferase
MDKNSIGTGRTKAKAIYMRMESIYDQVDSIKTRAMSTY